MKNVAASSDAFPTQRGFETGDDLNEENFDQLAQTAADRAEWLKLKVDTMLGIGVKKIRMVTSPTELKALTGMGSGDLALIPLTSSAAGLYVFQEGILPDNDVARWVYKANDESGVWGRDCVPLFASGGHDGNQPRLNTDTIRVPNSTLQVWETVETSPTYREVISDGDFAASGFAFGPQSFTTGDRALITCQFVGFTDGNNGVRARLAIHNGSSATEIAGTTLESSVAANGRAPFCMQGLWEVPSNGNYSIQLQLAGSNGDTVRAYAHRRIGVQLIRP
jgi:hypothetical protein